MDRQRRTNKNLNTTKPSPNFAGTRKFDVDRLHPTQLAAPSPSVDPDEPMGTGVVEKGRCIHIPNGKKVVAGTRPVEVDGTTVYRDVMREEYDAAHPGETVTLPVSEITRLTALGFLKRPDGKFAKPDQVAKNSTGIKDDPRVTGR